MIEEKLKIEIVTVLTADAQKNFYKLLIQSM